MEVVLGPQATTQILKQSSTGPNGKGDVILPVPNGREDSADYLCELLDFAMPWAGGQAALLVAYFDASERDGGTFCVAGLAFGADRAKKATREWFRLWGGQRCHMTDLHARKMRQSVQIITAHASYAVAVSCDVGEIARIAPKQADPGSLVFFDGFRRAYALCCHMAMFTLGKVVGEESDKTEIAYFFESGDKYQAESQRFIARMVSDPTMKWKYRHRSHSVLDKSDSRLFEMSDILAWEWAKHRERQRDGKPMRGSLHALLEFDSGLSSSTDFASKSHRAVHLTGNLLELFFRRAEEMGIFSDYDGAIIE